MVDELHTVLEASKQLGFLGPGPVEDHIVHAIRFARSWGAHPPGRALDLGSGGGVPGLVLAQHWSTTSWWLLDANQRRASFLREAVGTLGFGDRVQVVLGRAEDLGRAPALRTSMDLVTARSFGPPAVTAECASPFLVVGGALIVSEPPTAEGRWPADGVAQLGLRVGARLDGCQRLDQALACPERYPRRVGVPAKRPLF